MLPGRPIVDGIAITNIDVDFTTNPIHFRARIGYIHSKSGNTIAQTDWIVGPWSKDTLEFLRTLCDALERDASAKYLETSSSPSSPAKVFDAGGIAEFLSKDDAPSV